MRKTLLNTYHFNVDDSHDLPLPQLVSSSYDKCKTCSMQIWKGGGLGDFVTWMVMWHNDWYTHRVWTIMRPFLQYLVQGFETRIFEMECQYSLLFHRFESINANLWVTTVAHQPLCVYPLVYLKWLNVTLSPRLSFSIFGYCKWW